MNVFVKNVKIIDPNSEWHNKTVDVCVHNGIIKDIGSGLVNAANYQIIEVANLHLSQGWFDTSVCFGEPGFEERETINNGLNIAALSGFTAVALQPNTHPIIDNQSQIQFVKQKAIDCATELYPIGALSKNSEGIDLAELFDMKNAGAIAFGDYNKAIDNANFLKIALQYAQDFDGLIIAYSENHKLKGKGIVNEGVIATQLGLKGISNAAEEVEVARNLMLLEYTGGKLHIPTISTAKSVALISEAREKGLKVTCSVAVHNLVLTDEKLVGFDTRYKVVPPLRTEDDRKALLNGVLNNTIDCITSDHNPIDIEHKKMEFDQAKNGTIGLESAFSALLTVLPVEVIVDKLTYGRVIFEIESSTIKIGNKANISLFTTVDEWLFTKQSIVSKSKNSAFLNYPMKGKVIGVYNKSKLILANPNL